MKVARDIVKPIVVLTLVTLVVAAALAFTYRLTKPDEASGPDMALIAEKGKEAMPEADEFEQVETEAEGAVYAFKAKNNAGILIQGETIGYNKEVPISFLVGFNKEGSITGIAILSHEETPGVGTQIEEKTYTDQFVGKTGPVGTDAGDNAVDTITGATYSSKGLIEGVNNARKAYDALKGELS